MATMSSGTNMKDSSEVGNGFPRQGLEDAQYPKYLTQELIARSHEPPDLDQFNVQSAEMSSNDNTPSPESAISPLAGQDGGEYITLWLEKRLETPTPNKHLLFSANVTSARKSDYLPAIWYCGAEEDRFEVVAEVFDPLLFEGPNPSALANYAYAMAVSSRKATIGVQKSSNPGYYGSYTLHVPNAKGDIQEVRMILSKKHEFY